MSDQDSNYQGMAVFGNLLGGAFSGEMADVQARLDAERKAREELLKARNPKAVTMSGLMQIEYDDPDAFDPDVDDDEPPADEPKENPRASGRYPTPPITRR